MKSFRFLLTFLISLTLIVLLSVKIGKMPPLGKLLSPYHGMWQNAEKTDRELSSEISVPGLKAPVQVVYDEYHIPHIFAENTHDMYLAQGYVTAQHRLWQMEFQVFAAGGRVSEIIGPKALEFDRLQRRKGMVTAAKNSLQEMFSNPDSKLALEAYSRGVNSYIESLSYRNLPIEYKLLDYKPEQWSPLKSALLLKFMANDLSFREHDLENTFALNHFGKDLFDFLYPEVPFQNEPVIPKSKKWNFSAEPIQKQQIKLPDLSTINLQALNQPANEPFHKGSNNWAISGSKTKSGAPILANDPHLALRLPSLWYFIHLNSPDINVMGASLPGSSNVIVGFNDSIAWGVTNAKRDVKDWYAMQLRQFDQPEEYKFDGEWLKSKKVIEKIKIRGRDTFYDTVYYTHYGPIVYDYNFIKNNKPNNYALRWIAHDPSNELLTFIKLNQAHSYKEFALALQYYNCPAQNFAFASAQGDIALWVQGKFVNKWPEQGKFLMDGSTSTQQWQGFIPQLHNPNILNPERGYVSSANQYPVDTDYPYYIYDYTYENYRNRRINELLDTLVDATPKHFIAIQNDNFNYKAAEILPFLLSGLDHVNLTETGQKAYRILETWDFEDDTASIAPTIFEIWKDELSELIWDEFNGLDIPLAKPNWYRTSMIILHHPDFSFFDRTTTPQKETMNDMILLSFTNIIDKLPSLKQEENELKWSKFKPTQIQHLARLKPFSVNNIPISGNRNDINANFGNHGVSMRIITELGDSIRSYGIFPGGQSGNPGSKSFDNMILNWSKGEYIPLNIYVKPGTADNNSSIQHLKPKAQ